jgi:hypothetical protein
MYVEVLFAQTTRDRLHLYVVHTGAWRTLPDGELEARHRVGIALTDGFDAPVGQIADRSLKAFAAAGGFREEAEANPLHAPADDESPCHPHGAHGPGS